jgi:MFS family permease
MLSFNLILPEMNGFISQLGGSALKGSIIFLFSIAAGISRPFAGKLADLYQVADLTNQEILYKSFKSVFDKYAIEAKNLYQIA